MTPEKIEQILTREFNSKVPALEKALQAVKSPSSRPRGWYGSRKLVALGLGLAASVAVTFFLIPASPNSLLESELEYLASSYGMSSWSDSLDTIASDIAATNFDDTTLQWSEWDY